MTRCSALFPFDPIPRVIDADTWAQLESGLVQRIRALNAFLTDVYGAGEILKDGVVPRDLIIGSPQFRHAAAHTSYRSSEHASPS